MTKREFELAQRAVDVVERLAIVMEKRFNLDYPTVEVSDATQKDWEDHQLPQNKEEYEAFPSDQKGHYEKLVEDLRRF